MEQFWQSIRTELLTIRHAKLSQDGQMRNQYFAQSCLICITYGQAKIKLN